MCPLQRTKVVFLSFGEDKRVKNRILMKSKQYNPLLHSLTTFINWLLLKFNLFYTDLNLFCNSQRGAVVASIICNFFVVWRNFVSSQKAKNNNLTFWKVVPSRYGYRSELVRILGFLEKISKLCQKHCITTGIISFWCDGKSSLQLIFWREIELIAVNKKHSDLISAVTKELISLLLKYQPRHAISKNIRTTLQITLDSREKNRWM